ncbi:acyltransferase family protein [Thermopolyspora flexuosa]|uniref:Putative membrane protein YeiB n=1 Tax=Thermopolyspora flexuosa TaxID=103836 RepID=A0A543IXM2_9ACTN|nr:acyltransferase family protein [Thermopolyspora flexuosa]TQM75321.1 putative membrane protein YeiB [Thermopolyspora flexuosa]
MKHTVPAAPTEHSGNLTTRNRAPVRPDRPTDAVPSPEAGHGAGTGRLLGVDLARALAIYGMFAVHVGPSPDSVEGLARTLLTFAHGRSAALFALLAGVSLVLMSGREPIGRDATGRRVRVRVAVRALILLVFGTALTLIHSTIWVVVPYYGLFFLLALPALGLAAPALVTLAALSALGGPVVTMAPLVVPPELLDTVAAYDPLNLVSGHGLIELFLVGGFPAASWMAYVFAGMAIARLDLVAEAVRHRLVKAGAALAALGYGGSWLACNVFTDVQARVEATAAAVEAAGGHFDVLDHGTPLERLLVALPHSSSPFEITGNIGVAILVLVAAITLLEARPGLRGPAGPVLAVGTMSLTVYVVHILLIRYVDVEAHLGSPTTVLAVFVVAATLFAVAWKRVFRRGPLEFLLHFPAVRLSGMVR